MLNTTYLNILKDNNLIPAELMTKEGNLRLALTTVFYPVIHDIEHNKKNAVYHLKSWTRSKGHYKLIDEEHNRLKKVLDAYNISYAEGNDAAKGGLEGDYIKITYDYRNSSLKKIRKALADYRNN